MNCCVLIQLAAFTEKKYSDSRITTPTHLWDNLYGYDKVLQTAAEKVFSVIQNITQGDAHFSV